MHVPATHTDVTETMLPTQHTEPARWEQLTLPLMALSLSITVAGKVADNIWLTWLQVCEAFRSQAKRVSDTKDGMLVCFAHFQQDYKLGSQVTSLFAVCLDFDHQTTEAMNNAIALAQRISTRGIVHTTWSDEPATHLAAGENRCFRVIIPLDVPVSILQWADTWNTFAQAFETMAGAVADRQCRNPNRRYYVPTSKQINAMHGAQQDGTIVAPTVICWGE